MLAGEADQFTDILFILWKSDRLRHFAINRSVGRVELPHQIVEIKLAFELRSELFPIGLWGHIGESHSFGRIASGKDNFGRARLP